jgi:predicted nucleic acid-binding Zn ribbon protein
LYEENTIYHVYLIVAFILFVLLTLTYLHYYKSRVVLRKPLLWNHSFVEPFCYAASAAIIGTQAVLKSKCMAILIQNSIRGTKNEFAFWYIYFILGIWLILVAYWLNRLDNGLKLYPPLFIIPVMQVFFVFFAILCGGLYFEEFLGFSVMQFIGFGIGVGMILSGVYGLAPTDMVLKLPAEHGTVEEEQEEASAHLNDVEKACNTTAPLSIINGVHSLHLPNGTLRKSFSTTYSMDQSTSPNGVSVPQQLNLGSSLSGSSFGNADSDEGDDEDKPVWEIKKKGRFSPEKVVPIDAIVRTEPSSSSGAPPSTMDCDVDSVSSSNPSGPRFEQKEGGEV